MNTPDDFSADMDKAVKFANAGLGCVVLSAGIDACSNKYKINNHHTADISAGAGGIIILLALWLGRRKIAHIAKNLFNFK